MVIVARGASRNVRIVRIYPLTVLFTFTMVIIINCILGLTISAMLAYTVYSHTRSMIKHSKASERMFCGVTTNFYCFAI